MMICDADFDELFPRTAPAKRQALPVEMQARPNAMRSPYSAEGCGSLTRDRKFRRTTDSDHALNNAAKLLQHDCTASRPDQMWAGDITEFWLREGWVHAAVMLDLFSRNVIILRDFHANPFLAIDGPSATGRSNNVLSGH